MESMVDASPDVPSSNNPLINMSKQTTINIIDNVLGKEAQHMQTTESNANNSSGNSNNNDGT